MTVSLGTLMLISFTVKNFRSFRDSTELRMDASADTELSDTVRHVPGLPATYRGMLPVVSIHGPNASGKSNLVKAMKVLDSLVYMAVRYPDGIIPSYTSGPSRQIDPFRLDDNSDQPTRLEVVFLFNNMRWAYGLELDSTRIHSEWLLYWPEGRQVELFARGKAATGKKEAFIISRGDGDQPTVRRRSRSTRAVPKADPQQWRRGSPATATEHEECWTWGNDFDKGHTEGQALAGRTRQDVPFLSVAASWNHSQADQVLSWFNAVLVVDATAAPFRQWEQAARACASEPAFREWLERWMRAADLGISAIRIHQAEAEPDDLGSSLPSFVPKLVHVTPNGQKVEFDLQQESHGTNRLFVLGLSLYRALQTGGVLVVDELHAGLHPLLLRAIVKIFQSPDRNPLNAQLLFTTHDVSVLDNSLLRRDQIHIVEKSADGTSDLYSLSDFNEKPRIDSPLIKYYLSGNLGGVPDLDIDAVFPMT